MRFVDEFRDPAKARALLAAIDELAARSDRPLQIMEFCGGHTHALFRHGLLDRLAPAVEFVHGPGCPVCILPRERVDRALDLAARPRVILATFGDVLRVPGSRGSLAQARAQGADVRTVYSPLDALELARAHPRREVVFLAIGFETTLPATALTVLAAEREGLANFSLLCEHVTTPATLRALLRDPDLHLDGLIAPGHVAMVIGEAPFAFVAEEFAKPLVISGFEPLDLLHALWRVLRQWAAGEARVENPYARVVRPEGNPAGRDAATTVFDLAASAEVRGLGPIPGAGVRLRPAFAHRDAARRFHLPEPDPTPETTPCGLVLKGRLRPSACPHFGRACTPRTPLGAPMVSAEGACAAYHRFAARPAPEATR